MACPKYGQRTMFGAGFIPNLSGCGFQQPGETPPARMSALPMGDNCLLSPPAVQSTAGFALRRVGAAGVCPSAISDPPPRSAASGDAAGCPAFSTSLVGPFTLSLSSAPA